MMISIDDEKLKNFVMDGSENSIQTIISKLKFISKIQEGEKIDVHRLLLYPNTSINNVYRTIFSRGESRESALNFIKITIADALITSSSYLKNDQQLYQDIGFMILKSLEESKIGIKNIIETYKNDRMYTSKFETLISTLDTKLSYLKSIYCRT